MKVYFDTVGCRLNQAEIERMAFDFRQAGYEILDAPVGADLVIINSCTVTAAAASDSRQKVRQAYKAGAKKIILTGCWATMSPQEAAALPGVERIFSNSDKNLIPERLTGRSNQKYELEPLKRKPLPGIHRRTRAFIKVQDGCDNHCTFCITRIARGKSISVDKQEILRQIQIAERGGTHEIVLSGVNLGAWGKDLSRKEILADLIAFILDNSQIERIRLSSIEPWDMDAAFLNLWQNQRICRHLHIPLQSGSESTLRRMARNTSPEKFRSLIKMIRSVIPDMAITTDIIVGFAGENEEEFAESLHFVKEMNFAGGHVFRYSPREGTPAFNLPGRVDGKIAHIRSEVIRSTLHDSEQNYWLKFIGKTVNVLWESAIETESNQLLLHGLTENYLPVSVRCPEDHWNMIEKVQLLRIQEDQIGGDFLN